MTTSGRMRPFVAQTTGQYLDPLLVFTNLVRLTSRFMVPPIRLIAKYGSSIGSSCSQSQDNKGNGGEGGIRTPDTLSGMPVFKTGAINHSATSPAAARSQRRRAIRRCSLVYNRRNQISGLGRQAEGSGMKFHDFFKVRQKIGQAVVARVRVIFMLHAFFLQLVVQGGRS